MVPSFQHRRLSVTVERHSGHVLSRSNHRHRQSSQNTCCRETKSQTESQVSRVIVQRKSLMLQWTLCPCGFIGHIFTFQTKQASKTQFPPPNFAVVTVVEFIIYFNNLLIGGNILTWQRRAMGSLKSDWQIAQMSPASLHCWLPALTP